LVQDPVSGKAKLGGCKATTVSAQLEKGRFATKDEVEAFQILVKGMKGAEKKKWSP
jgi:hypothetical protein